MLYLDASRYSNTLKRTGVENYSYFLINELLKLAPDDITLISPKKINLPAKQIVIPFPRLWTQLRLSLKLFLSRKIKNLFVPSHVMPIIHPKNTVITIHDVAFKRFPKSYGRMSRWYLNWGTKYAVKHARHIITPSETTKKDLIKYYRANPDKITVIPLGYGKKTTHHSDFEINKTLQNYSLQTKNYLLFVGRIESKKNIQTLVRAFESFSKIHPTVKLVLAGKTGVGGSDVLKSINNPNIVVTGFIHNKEKQILLEHCLCFVFPSLFEGFGLPLLEAMEAKVPIIASKIPTSFEIAKQNALFFKTHDTEELAHLMNQIVTNTDLRQKLTAHHKETLRKYSWEKCAKETLRVLQKYS